MTLCGFLLGRNAHLSHFSRGEIRMCHISPGEKLACVALLPGRNRMLFGVAPLAMIIPRFWGFSRGESDNMCGFLAGEKCAPVAFLLGGSSHALHFSRGETRTCRIFPGEKRACVAFLPGRNSHVLHLKFSQGETRMCRISPGGKFARV